MFHQVSRKNGHNNDGQHERHAHQLIAKTFHNLASIEMGGQRFMSKHDAKAGWLFLFGYKIAKHELLDYFSACGKDYYGAATNNGLSFAEFERKAMSEWRRVDPVDEMRNTFINVDQACKGFLTLDDMRRMFALVAPHLGPSLVEQTFW
jgi:hypothetical protein